MSPTWLRTVRRLMKRCSASASVDSPQDLPFAPRQLGRGVGLLRIRVARIGLARESRGDRGDLVVGDLRLLARSGGDYALATKGCVANDTPPPGVEFLQTPEPEHGYWLLVRGVGEAGPGTYNTPAPTQVGDRDLEIAASPNPGP